MYRDAICISLTLFSAAVNLATLAAHRNCNHRRRRRCRRRRWRRRSWFSTAPFHDAQLCAPKHHKTLFVGRDYKTTSPLSERKREWEKRSGKSREKNVLTTCD